MKRVWQVERAAVEALERGEPVVLATIMSLTGSAPRTAGAKMLVLGGAGPEDVRIVGTIGGGRLEAEVMCAARALLGRETGLTARFDLTGADASDMDMICGGRLEVLLEPLTPGSGAEQVFSAALAAVERGRRAGVFAFVTALAPAEEAAPAPTIVSSAQTSRTAARPVRLARSLVRLDGDAPEVVAGPAQAAPRLAELARLAGRERAPTALNEPDGRFLVEPLTEPGAVWLMGAGHVSQKIAHLAGFCGFRTLVFDDRAEFASRERFPEADDLTVLAAFDDVFAKAGLGLPSADDYVIIVTRGHGHDKEVLEQTLRTRAGYVGMIGSRRKRDAVYDALRQAGFTQADLDRVHCPIGLEIAADTPEEIAVSVLAELIQARAGREGA